MNISFRWLKEFVKFNQSYDKIAEMLTLAGAEVDTIKKSGNDYILDMEITPNRGDELSVIGIAREVSALTGNKLIKPKININETEAKSSLNIKIEDEMACPRFTYRIIKNLKLGASPDWLIKRLKSYGFRPINNIVDVTNYVMIEMGQPLHAFDYYKIKGHQMVVRRAKEGERVTTLDGHERILTQNAVIIEDSENIIDLAGIMGGQNSEVDEKTKTIVLEAALFNPVLIRKTSKEQGLTTDASYRFERQIDPEGCVLALDRAAELIQKCAEGRVEPMVDLRKIKYEPKKVSFSIADVSSLLGIKITESESIKILKSLGFEIISKQKSKITVLIPSWRNDIEIWQDIAEEIARIKGYSKLKVENLAPSEIDNQKTTFMQKELLKDRLNDLGFSEIYSYSFLSDKDLEILKKTPEFLFEVENPVAPENRYLRDSLLPSLIKSIAKNPTFNQIKVFEIGQVFDLKRGERTFIGIAIAGNKTEVFTKILEKINQLTLTNLQWKTRILNQDELKNYKIKKRQAAIAEADLSQFLRDMPMRGALNDISVKDYREISKYPSVTRDFAFVLNKEIQPKKLAKSVKSISDSIVRVELFDEYQSDKFGKGMKSIAYHIQFQADDHTLTKSEADNLSKKIIRMVKIKYQGKLRDK